MADKITKTVDNEVAKKDINGDGHISKEELEMDLEFKRRELEDADARRDAMRKMTWFALMQHHKYSLTELENMIPFEREIYVGLLMNYIKEEKEKEQARKNKRG